MNLTATIELYAQDGRARQVILFQGLKIGVENPKGSVRRGTDVKTGKPWATKMVWPYGYIRKTEGVDGDKVDVFVGPFKNAKTAYVVHQNDPNTGEYDEDKVLLGFPSAASAKRAYMVHYDEPEKFFGSLSQMSMAEFKRKAMATDDKPQMIAQRKR